MAGHGSQDHKTGYLALIALFWTAFAGLSGGRRPLPRGMTDLVLLGLASFRLGRLASYDKVTEPLRAPFTEVTPSPSGAGALIEPKGSGVQRTLGSLLSCPVCTGTWMSAMLVYGLRYLPTRTRVFVWIMAATGAAELLNGMVEAFKWTGSAARAATGSVETYHQQVQEQKQG